ncbi:MAG: hypothetical protein ONA90_02815 [candidate division KSB1 bacterium]|nr:hypothetical protein [candidate division KSB1 bacterium]
MQSTLLNLTYEVELKEGEAFSFPEDAAKQIKPGKWVISISPADKMLDSKPIRGYGAFLNSYVDDDEGIYDDYPTR